jgi:hypothetical protein
MAHSMYNKTGTATGGGTTIHNNQRLMVAHLGHIWKDDPEKGGAVPFVDAAIVGWNMRDKKTADGPMTFLRPKNFDFDAGRHHFTPIYEQSKYKYLIYVDGHCAACRYGFMMRLGSVILKVRCAGCTNLHIFDSRKNLTHYFSRCFHRSHQDKLLIQCGTFRFYNPMSIMFR